MLLPLVSPILILVIAILEYIERQLTLEKPGWLEIFHATVLAGAFFIGVVIITLIAGRDNPALAGAYCDFVVGCVKP